MTDNHGARRAASHSQGRAARAALVLVFALVGLWPAVAGAQAAAGSVTLYADLNYTGSSLTMSGDIAALSGVGFNDATTSLKVATGTRVAVFSDANYNGACEEFTASDADLRNNRIGDDRISSLWVNRACPPVQLFADLAYGGDNRVVKGDIPDLGALGFDDAATSLRVPAGTTLTVYEHPNYGGICQEFTANDGDLRDNPAGNDRISSVQLNKPCPARATLFADRNYGGAYHTVIFNRNNQDQLNGFQYMASSIYITGSLQVTAWYQPYTAPARCTTFTASDPDLSDTWVGDDSINWLSSRHVDSCEWR